MSAPKMITYEDLRTVMDEQTEKFISVEGWIHHRGFNEDDLNEWINSNAKANLLIAALDGEVVPGVGSYVNPMDLARSSLLVGLSIGFELGYKLAKK